MPSTSPKQASETPRFLRWLKYARQAAWEFMLICSFLLAIAAMFGFKRLP